MCFRAYSQFNYVCPNFFFFISVSIDMHLYDLILFKGHSLKKTNSILLYDSIEIHNT